MIINEELTTTYSESEYVTITNSSGENLIDKTLSTIDKIEIVSKVPMGIHFTIKLYDGTNAIILTISGDRSGIDGLNAGYNNAIDINNNSISPIKKIKVEISSDSQEFKDFNIKKSLNNLQEKLTHLKELLNNTNMISSSSENIKRSQGVKDAWKKFCIDMDLVGYGK
jgi:hypothetical protein